MTKSPSKQTTKASQIIKLLSRANGASLDELMKVSELAAAQRARVFVRNSQEEAGPSTLQSARQERCPAIPH